MYWPIGAPRIYAASSSKAPRDRVSEVDDDAESRETTEESGSSVELPSVQLEGKTEEEDNLLSPPQVPPTPGTPLTPGINPVEDEFRRAANPLPLRDGEIEHPLREAQKDPLLTLVLSRTGHLFAVITTTSLTIWQTKVYLLDSLLMFLADINIAHCHSCCRGAIQEIIEHIRSECLSVSAP